MPYGGVSYAYSSGEPTYQLITAPAENPVSLAELKAWLKISNNAQDAILTAIIVAVTKSAELYTKREFINKEFRTFRDYFGDYNYPGYGGYYFFFNNENPIEIRRTHLKSITHVKYINTQGTQITIDSADYYITSTDGSTFSLLLPVPDKNWPSDLQQKRLQNVEIQFTAGWTDAAEFKENWPDLYQALLAHMADVFINRGDCSDISGQCGCATAPVQARRVYDLYRIVDFATY